MAYGDRVVEMPQVTRRSFEFWQGCSLDRVYIALAIAPVALIFVGIYLGSLARLVLLSVDSPHFSFAEYVSLFSNPQLLETLAYTMALAAGITLISLVLSYPVALVMLYAAPWYRNLLTLLIIVPMWISTLVRSYSWMVLLGRRGVINEVLFKTGLSETPISLLYNRFAVCIGLVYVMLPFTVFPIYSAMKQIDRHLLNASRSLGATPLTSFVCIFFPLTLPGAAVGAVLVFVLAIAYWVTPMLLGGLNDTTFVMLIEQQINIIGNWNFAAAMSVAVLVITLSILLLFQKLIGFSLTTREANLNNRNLRLIRMFSLLAPFLNRLTRSHFAAHTQADNSHAANLEMRPSLPLSKALTFLVILFLVGPILVLIPLSFSATPYMEFPPTGFSLRWYQAYFSSADWTGATFVSLRVACGTALLSVVFGTTAAIVLTKARFWGRVAVIALLMSPMVVPNIVIAVALYFQFAPMGLVGTEIGLVLAHLILTIPFVLMVVMGGLQGFDSNLELASRSLGAGPIATFRWILMPLIMPAILSAAFFAFIVSFDEVVVAVFLSGTTAATLPKILLNATRFEFRPTIAAVSVILIAATFVLVLTAHFVQRRFRRRHGLQDASSIV